MSVEGEDTHNSMPENSTPEKNQEKNKSKVPLYAAGSILLLAAVFGMVYWLYTRQFVSTDDAFIEGNIVYISPKVTSHVVKINISENQYVRKGELLVELDTDEFEAKVEKAKAELQAALAAKEKSLANAALVKNIKSRIGTSIFQLRHCQKSD